MVFLYEHTQSEEVTTSDIKAALKKARDRSGTADGNLSRSIATLVDDAYVVDSGSKRGRETLWAVTGSGLEAIYTIVGAPDEEPTELEREALALSAMVADITDPDVRDYANEGITCLRIGMQRAAIVFLWAGALRVIHQAIYDNNKRVDVFKLLQNSHPRNKEITKMEDWQYISDSDVLKLTRDLKVYDKTEYTMLGHQLDLRNHCGHPSTYKPTVTKTKAFIEDLVTLVFTRKLF